MWQFFRQEGYAEIPPARARMISSIPWFRKRPVGLDFEKAREINNVYPGEKMGFGFTKIGKSI
jgi:hypothetical protein